MPTAPAFGALYLLREPAVGRAFRGSVAEPVAEPVAESARSTSGAEADSATEEAPVPVRHLGGSAADDFIWTDQGVICISDRVVRTLRVNAVTGWETFAVEVSSRAERTLSGYAGFRVTGAGGPLDFSASETIDKITPSGRERAFLGRYFDRDAWDGSMIFTPEGSADIVVTERVRDLFERAKIGNVELIPLDDVEVSGEEVARWREASGPGLS